MAFANTVLIVFAAASLHGAFSAIGTQFERTNPGATVRFDFDGSQSLETQLANGAHADVFASADRRWMKRAEQQHLVSSPKTFAGNAIAAIISPTSPVRSLRDLTRPGMRIDICADSVPCGRYARQALARLSLQEPVMRNVVSNELNVEAVLTKVEFSEVDAGFVYTTDARAAGSNVRVISVPRWAQPSISYPIAATVEASNARLAQSFVTFVRSPAGQAILRRYGFTPSR